MTRDQPTHFSDDERSRDQLLEELAELCAGLAAEQELNRKQAREIASLRSRDRRESEETFSKAFFASPSFLFISEFATGIFVEANDAYCALTGYSRDEMVGHSSVELGIISVESRGRIIRFLQESGRIQNSEIEIISKAGEVRICLFSAERLTYGYRDCLICSGIDITERKRMEALSRQNEERFRLMFTNAPMAYQSLDEYGNFLDVNQAFTDALGYSREELIGRNFGDLLDPEWMDHFKVNFPRFKAVGEVLGVEFRMVKKNGDTVLVFFNGKIQRDDQGRFQRTHCILQDITERKLAEQALRRERAIAESERNRLQAVLEVLPVPVFIADADGKMVSINREANKTWGEAPLSEGVPAYGEDYKAWWPDTGKRVRAHEWGMARALSKGEQCVAEEMEIETRDGRRKTILNYARPILDSAGRITGGVAINVDITDRKNAEAALRVEEERFRLAAKAGKLGAYSRNLRTGVDYWSPEFLAIFGLGPNDRLPMKDGIPAAVHPEDRPKVLAAARIRVEGALNPEFNTEHRIVLPDGGIRWVMIRGMMEFDGRGRPARTHGFVMDITERKEAEAALRVLNETLEQRVRERTALAEARARQLQELSVELIEAEERERRRFSDLLHEDLQQDLAAARFQIQAASRSQPPFFPVLDRVEKLLKETIEKSRRLSHELSPSVLNHSGLIDALQWLIRRMGEQFGLRIRLEAEAVPKIEDQAVKIFLFRAVQELLFNVFKHAGVKTARVVLSGSDGCIAITVIDGGNGFDPGLLHAATVKDGLGLISLRERANYLGGSFDIESEPGRGSRFTLTVPLDLSAADEVGCGD